MTTRPRLSRRSLLVGTALTGAAASVATTAQAATPVAPTDDKRTVVLKDTPHTRAYMALARKG